MLKNITLILLTIVLVTACSKNKKSEFFVMRTGDFQMTCSSIEIEEEKIQKDIQKLEDQIKVKSLKNTTLFYLALPTLGLSLLFADFTGEEKEQISLYNDRIKHLGDIEKLKCASQP